MVAIRKTQKARQAKPKKKSKPAKSRRAKASPATHPGAPSAGKPGAKLQLTTPAQPPKPVPPPESAASRLDQTTIRSAIASLLRDRSAHRAEDMGVDSAAAVPEADADELLPPDDYLYLQLTLKLAPPKDNLRPRMVPLPHTLFDSDTDDVCMFVRDPQRLVKDYLSKRNDRSVTKVMGVSKLVKRYNTAESRRELHRQFDVFLADERIAPMLPRMLGRHFIEGANMPRPVKMSNNVLASIRRALASTPFRARRGTSSTLRVARLNFETEHMVENVLAAVDGVVARVDGQWDNVQALSLKTVQSPALPLYVELPATETVVLAGTTEAGAAGTQADSDDDSDDEEDGAKDGDAKDGKPGSAQKKKQTPKKKQGQQRRKNSVATKEEQDGVDAPSTPNKAVEHAEAEAVKDEDEEKATPGGKKQANGAQKRKQAPADAKPDVNDSGAQNVTPKQKRRKTPKKGGAAGTPAATKGGDGEDKKADNADGQGGPQTPGSAKRRKGRKGQAGDGDGFETPTKAGVESNGTPGAGSTSQSGRRTRARRSAVKSEQVKTEA